MAWLCSFAGDIVQHLVSHPKDDGTCNFVPRDRELWDGVTKKVFNRK
jgi:hypothetical protein